MQFYADENIESAIIDGLRLRGITIQSVQEAGKSGLPDELQLRHAKSVGAILITRDTDFLHLCEKWKQRGISFPGLLFIPSKRISIGECIREIESLTSMLNSEAMINHIEFL